MDGSERVASIAAVGAANGVARPSFVRAVARPHDQESQRAEKRHDNDEDGPDRLGRLRQRLLAQPEKDEQGEQQPKQHGDALD